MSTTAKPETEKTRSTKAPARKKAEPARKPRKPKPMIAPRPDVTPPVPLASGSVGFQILAVCRHYNADLLAAFTANPTTRGLTVPRYLTLRVIRASPNIHGAGMARAVQISPQTMTTIMTGLVDLGWIERTNVPGHGRVVYNTLTPAGRRVLDAAEEAVGKVDAKLEKAFSHDDGRGIENLGAMLHQAEKAFSPAA